VLEISPEARVSALADIEPSVRGSRIVIAAGVMIDAFVKVKPAGGAGDLLIGRNSYINSGVVIYTGNGVLIGEDVLIGANCTLAPVSHEFKDAHRKIVEQGFMPGRGGLQVLRDVRQRSEERSVPVFRNRCTA